MTRGAMTGAMTGAMIGARGAGYGEGPSPAAVAQERRRAVLKRLEALRAGVPAERPSPVPVPARREALSQGDWLNALDLVRQAAALVGTTEDRASRLEAQRADAKAELEALRAGRSRAEARAAEAEARQAAAELRAETAEGRLHESEVWLKTIYDAIVEGFPVAEPLKEAAAG